MNLLTYALVLDLVILFWNLLFLWHWLWIRCLWRYMRLSRIWGQHHKCFTAPCTLGHAQVSCLINIRWLYQSCASLLNGPNVRINRTSRQSANVDDLFGYLLDWYVDYTLAKALIHFAHNVFCTRRPLSSKVTFWRFTLNLRRVECIDLGTLRPKLVFFPQWAHLAILSHLSWSGNFKKWLARCGSRMKTSTRLVYHKEHML